MKERLGVFISKKQIDKDQDIPEGSQDTRNRKPPRKPKKERKQEVNLNDLSTDQV